MTKVEQKLLEDVIVQMEGIVEVVQAFQTQYGDPDLGGENEDTPIDVFERALNRLYQYYEVFVADRGL